MRAGRGRSSDSVLDPPTDRASHSETVGVKAAVRDLSDRAEVVTDVDAAAELKTPTAEIKEIRRHRKGDSQLQLAVPPMGCARAHLILILSLAREVCNPRFYPRLFGAHHPSCWRRITS